MKPDRWSGARFTQGLGPGAGARAASGALLRGDAKLLNVGSCTHGEIARTRGLRVRHRRSLVVLPAG